eukprot:3277787-Amphidinium_carterae.1
MGVMLRHAWGPGSAGLKLPGGELACHRFPYQQLASGTRERQTSTRAVRKVSLALLSVVPGRPREERSMGARQLRLHHEVLDHPVVPAPRLQVRARRCCQWLQHPTLS